MSINSKALVTFDGTLYFKFKRFKDLKPRLNLNVLNFKKVEFWSNDNKLNINTIKKPA